MEDARAAVDELGAPRVALLGFSMGGAVSIAIANEPVVEEVVGLAPWIPDQLDVTTLRGKRLTVLHGALDRWLPGVPGVSASHSRKGYDRARERGAEGRYVLIPARCTDRVARAVGGARPGCRRPTAGPGSSREELRRFVRGHLSAASRRRRASWSPDGVLTFHTSRTRSSRRITPPRCVELEAPEAVRAEAGNAWWLLCQPSPGTRSATSQLFRASSRERYSWRPNMWQIEFTEKVASGRGRSGTGRPTPSPRARVPTRRRRDPR